MNHLKVVNQVQTGYNKPLMNHPSPNMDPKPVNPERLVDQKLVEKAQRGDKRAFGILVEKYHKK